MALQSALQAYRQSAYQRVENDIQYSVDHASMPIFGGLLAEIRNLGNVIARPFKVAAGFVFGGQYPLENVEQVQLPDDIKGTKYAEALEKTREYGHETADMRTIAYGKLAHGDVGGYFRAQRAADYDAMQRSKVILPDEDAGGLARGVIGTASLIGSGELLTHGAFLKNAGVGGPLAVTGSLFNPLVVASPYAISRAVTNALV